MHTTNNTAECLLCHQTSKADQMFCSASRWKSSCSRWKHQANSWLTVSCLQGEKKTSRLLFTRMLTCIQRFASFWLLMVASFCLRHFETQNSQGTVGCGGWGVPGLQFKTNKQECLNWICRRCIQNKTWPQARYLAAGENGKLTHTQWGLQACGSLLCTKLINKQSRCSLGFLFSSVLFHHLKGSDLKDAFMHKAVTNSGEILTRESPHKVHYIILLFITCVGLLVHEHVRVHASACLSSWNISPTIW